MKTKEIGNALFEHGEFLDEILENLDNVHDLDKRDAIKWVLANAVPVLANFDDYKSTFQKGYPIARKVKDKWYRIYVIVE